MHFLKKTCCVLSLVFLGGCSSLNIFGGDKAGANKPTELANFAATASASKRWSVQVGSGKGFHLKPAILDQSVVAAAGDGTLTRIDLSSGKRVWQIKAGTPLTAGVGIGSGTVAVAGNKGVILAFDAAGTLKWKAQASSEVLSAPAVGQGLVIIRSIDNQIAAFDAETGSRRWVVQRPLPPLTLRAAPGITLSNDSAFVALPGGRLTALSLLNGGPRWEVPVGDPRGTTELERIADVSGSPVVIGQSVCAVAYQGRIACLDPANGAPRWVQDFSSDAGLSAGGSRLFASNEKGELVAFEQSSGQQAWRNDKLAYRGLSPSGVHGDLVVVGDAAGYVHLLSSGDGSFAARLPTDGSAIRSAPVSSDSVIVVQTEAGTVTALTVGKQ